MLSLRRSALVIREELSIGHFLLQEQRRASRFSWISQFFALHKGGKTSHWFHPLNSLSTRWAINFLLPRKIKELLDFKVRASSRSISIRICHAVLGGLNCTWKNTCHDKTLCEIGRQQFILVLYFHGLPYNCSRLQFKPIYSSGKVVVTDFY